MRVFLNTNDFSYLNLAERSIPLPKTKNHYSNAYIDYYLKRLEQTKDSAISLNKSYTNRSNVKKVDEKQKAKLSWQIACVEASAIRN